MASHRRAPTGLTTHSCGQACHRDPFAPRNAFTGPPWTHPQTSTTHPGPLHSGLTPSSQDPRSLPPALPSLPGSPPLSFPVLLPSSCLSTCWPAAQLRATDRVTWLFLPRLLRHDLMLIQDKNTEICLFKQEVRAAGLWPLLLFLVQILLSMIPSTMAGKKEPSLTLRLYT